MRDDPLDDHAISEALTSLPGWSRDGDALTARFTGDRAAITGLYSDIAAVEDGSDHHAEITVLYNRLGFRLNTHDSGDRITWRDVELARSITELCEARGFKA
jgi:4a-hydroxytetrahydrobiopterin dehydratase